MELLKRDRNYKKGIARQTMLQIFELLGGEGELVNNYRRKLASTLL